MKKARSRRKTAKKPGYFYKQLKKIVICICIFGVVMGTQQLNSPLAKEVGKEIVILVSTDYDATPVVRTLKKWAGLESAPSLNVYNQANDLTESIKSIEPAQNAVDFEASLNDVPNDANEKSLSSHPGVVSNSQTAGKTAEDDSNTEKVNDTAQQDFVIPVNGVLSSTFGKRIHPFYKDERMHEGIDIEAPEGQPIVAARDGVVEKIYKSPTYGNLLWINHGEGLKTMYAHCSEILVKEKEKVKRGQVIAKVGNTGLSTGPHLHFEILENGKSIDPLTKIQVGRK